MFSPPPSPLPPRHPPVESSSDGDDDADDNSLTLTAEEIPQITGEVKANRPIIPAQSSSGLVSSSRIRRHLLVFMVPLILLIVCSTSSFIAAHEERGADNNLPLWRETFGGSLRDPSFPPMIAIPAHHMLGSLSRHLHRARLYGVGRGLSPSFPVPPTNEPRGYGDNEGKKGGVPVAQTTEPPTPTVVNAARDARESAPSIPAQPWPVPTPFPQPFDSSLSYNFTTSSCLAFFTNQLANNTFRACRPFGLLFGTSTDFFAIQANLTELTAVIEGTCNTDPTEDSCVSIMDWMAGQMVLPSVCRDDLSLQNSIALEAWYGFKSYKLFREAGCLVNPRTNAYCFVEALAQLSPSDLYYYALPLGTPIPGTTPTTTTSGSATPPAPLPAPSSPPSCSTCVSNLMALYAPYASDPSFLLGLTYPPAANAANKQCGNGYAPGPETVVASPTPPVPFIASKKGGALPSNVLLRWRQGQDVGLATGFVLVFMTAIFALAQSLIL